MGYTTEFTGEFRIDPPLDFHQRNYLNLFSISRRVSRYPEVVEPIPDPFRQAVGLPVGKDAEFSVLGAFTMLGYTPPRLQNTYGALAEFEKCVVRDTPPGQQPGLWAQWIPTEDGIGLKWDGGEKFYNYVEWLQYYIHNFLKPWGHELSGEVLYQGESENDKGTIRVVGVHVFKEPHIATGLAFANISIGLNTKGTKKISLNTTK